MYEAIKMIRSYMSDKGISKVKLAKLLGTSAQNINNKLSRESITVEFLDQVSTALKHNFYIDLSREWERKVFDINNVVMEDPKIEYQKGQGVLERYIETVIEAKLSSKGKK